MVDELVTETERWMDVLFLAAPGASLRREDKRKAVEVAAMLVEIQRAARRFSRKSPLLVVDAAAGKSYVGLLAAKLIFESSRRPASIVTIERDARRANLSRQAAARLQTEIPIDCRAADVSSCSAWPDQPSIVAALHACGPAADAVIAATIAKRARTLLLVPCCTSKSVSAAVRAGRLAPLLGIPRHSPVRRRFVQALVDAERTCRLEAAGYYTEVVEFVAATLTPHNLLWRANLVAEPVRMAAAAQSLQVLERGIPRP